jgi:CitB family two-component system response regulator MalR
MVKVLLVEDDPMVAKFNEHYISQIKGFELADKASNGEDALKFLAKKQYDLILLDIFMPNMDGLQLLHQIREKSVDVDIIIISAARDKERIQAALREGAVDYIIKPFEFERLRVALTNFFRRKQAFEGKAEFDQDELDGSLYFKEEMNELSVPKGLDRNTLKAVWQEVCRMDDLFTTEEIAAMVGISRVSVRKYLDFLKALKAISLELHRGAVGRPVYKYKCIDKSFSLVGHFFQ